MIFVLIKNLLIDILFGVFIDLLVNFFGIECETKISLPRQEEKEWTATCSTVSIFTSAVPTWDP